MASSQDPTSTNKPTADHQKVSYAQASAKNKPTSATAKPWTSVVNNASTTNSEAVKMPAAKALHTKGSIVFGSMAQDPLVQTQHGKSTGTPVPAGKPSGTSPITVSFGTIAKKPDEEDMPDNISEASSTYSASVRPQRPPGGGYKKNNYAGYNASQQSKDILISDQYQQHYYPQNYYPPYQQPYGDYTFPPPHFNYQMNQPGYPMPAIRPQQQHPGAPQAVCVH